MPDLMESFRKVFRETASPSEADYVAHVNRDGTTGTVGDVVRGFNARSIGVVANPLGVNRWTGGSGDDWKLVRICFGSLSPDMERKPPVWDSGRWERLAARYGLPTEPEWKRRPADHDVVVLLPKIGGWLGLDARRYTRQYAGFVRDVAREHPGSTVVVRPHPRNVARRNPTVEGIFAALVEAGGGAARLDTARAVTEEQFARTKLVVCDWSTAVLQFVMRGIPVANPDKNRPGKMIAHVGASGGCTVPELMNAVCQTVAEPHEAHLVLAAFLRRGEN